MPIELRRDGRRGRDRCMQFDAAKLIYSQVNNFHPLSTHFYHCVGNLEVFLQDENKQSLRHVEVQLAPVHMQIIVVLCLHK